MHQRVRSSSVLFPPPSWGSDIVHMRAIPARTFPLLVGQPVQLVDLVVQHHGPAYAAVDQSAPTMLTDASVVRTTAFTELTSATLAFSTPHAARCPA